MQCIHPIEVLNERTGRRTRAPCGRCIACRRRKQNEWAFRILEEARVSKSVFWVCLTYDDSHLVYGDGRPTLDKTHLSLFVRYLRRKYVYLLRFFACGEYGDTYDRPHYHLIVFFKDDVSLESMEEACQESWQHGFVTVEIFCGTAHAKYAAKYSCKQIGIDYTGIQSPFALMSRDGGIGVSFKNAKELKRVRYRNSLLVHDDAGTPYMMPRFYRDYFFTKDEQDEFSMINERLLFDRLDYVSSLIHGDDRFVYKPAFLQYKELRRLQSFEDDYKNKSRLHLATDEMYKDNFDTSVVPVYSDNSDILPNYEFDGNAGELPQQPAERDPDWFESVLRFVSG